MSRLRVCAVTTSRAEYGLLRWILKRLHADRSVDLQLVVSGTHLAGAFGRTVKEIEADRLPIAARLPMLAKNDTGAAAAAAVGKGLAAFGALLARLKPDWLLVLGDRYELLAPCAAAVALRLPIAHLHGGEATEGVLDEQVRHAVTKLAHLHFAAAEPYRLRIVSMGERPARVHNVGAPGLEAVAKTPRMGRAELEALLGFSLAGPLAVMTFHPEDAARAAAETRLVLAALRRRGLRVVATYAGADAGGRAVNAELVKAAKKEPSAVLAVPSLGQRRYLSLLALADVVAGNSSSGLLEAPALRLPTVNAGGRQRGRLRAPSVIDCALTAGALDAALKRALSPAFRKLARRGVTPYGGGEVSARVVRLLKAADPKTALDKRFHA